MKRARYRLMPSKDGGWYFVLDASNGEPIATSETYTSKESAKNGIRSMRTSAPFATVEEPVISDEPTKPNDTSLAS